jgi:hypothetical protein
MGKTKPPKLNEIDREAMDRAIEMGRSRCKADRDQLDEMLREKPWREVGEFAAYSAQCHSLRLKPWQTPPTEIGDPDLVLAHTRDDHRGYRSAARLLKRLLDARLSRFEPDPLAALANAEHAIDAAE